MKEIKAVKYKPPERSFEQRISGGKTVSDYELLMVMLTILLIIATVENK